MGPESLGLVHLASLRRGSRGFALERAWCSQGPGHPAACLQAHGGTGLQGFWGEGIGGTV